MILEYIKVQEELKNPVTIGKQQFFKEFTFNFKHIN